MTAEPSDTRAEILAATIKLAAKRGVGAVTMADVAKAAGVSRQAVYLHFGTRGKLMSAMMRQRMLQHPLAQEVRRLTTPPASIEKFEAFVAAAIRFTAAVAGPAIIEFAQSVDDKVVLTAVRERMAAGSAMIARMMEDLKRQGLLQPRWTALEAAEWTSLLLSPPNFYLLTTVMKWPVDRVIDRALETMRRDLLKPLSPP